MAHLVMMLAHPINPFLTVLWESCLVPPFAVSSHRMLASVPISVLCSLTFRLTLVHVLQLGKLSKGLLLCGQSMAPPGQCKLGLDVESRPL